MLAEGIERLSNLQERLYAQDRWSVLIVLQAMDAAGKDSVIKHVLSGINPQGCEVHSFKQPSEEELAHDFLWRIAQRLPARGRIGIFNRSHYEEVLTVRVHPELLERERLPKECVSKDIWHQRFKDIRAFERHLARNGTLILKFFLNVSRDEQRKRFLERIDEPAKRWKFSMGDVAERKLWPKYMDAYEDMLRQTSRPGGAVVRGARRQQMVHPAGGGGSSGGSDGETQAGVSARSGQSAQGIAQGPQGIERREVIAAVAGQAVMLT